MNNRFHFERYSKIPFPEQKYVPGQGKHPHKKNHKYTIPEFDSDKNEFDVSNWSKSQKYLYAIDLFNYEYWWEAHELLEDLWIQTGKLTPNAKFIQGIIQISAALIKKSQSLQPATSKLLSKALLNINIKSGFFLGINITKLLIDIENYFNTTKSDTPKIILSFKQENN